MNQKLIFKLLLIAVIFSIFFLLRNNYKQYKISKSNKDIEIFYTELDERYIGDYFQIQSDLTKLLLTHDLSTKQKERLLFTQDSLRTEFRKLTKDNIKKD